MVLFYYGIIVLWYKCVEMVKWIIELNFIILLNYFMVLWHYRINIIITIFQLVNYNSTHFIAAATKSTKSVFALIEVEGFIRQDFVWQSPDHLTISTSTADTLPTPQIMITNYISTSGALNLHKIKLSGTTPNKNGGLSILPAVTATYTIKGQSTNVLHSILSDIIYIIIRALSISH